MKMFDHWAECEYDDSVFAGNRHEYRDENDKIEVGVENDKTFFPFLVDVVKCRIDKASLFHSLFFRATR